MLIIPVQLVLKCVGSQGTGGLLEDLGSDLCMRACVCVSLCVRVSLCAGSLCVSLSVFYSCTEGRVLPLSPPPLF